MMGFPHMIPYANPLYFIYLLVALLPMILTLLIKGKRWSWYQVLVTLFFLYMSFGGEDWKQGVALIGYVIWQTILVWFYFHYRQKQNAAWAFYLAVFLAILPLVLVKVVPFVSGHASLLGFLGISYLTFKSVQIIMEMRDGSIKEYNVFRYIQFLLFFPTISSGPIDRYRRFEKDVENPPAPEKYVDFLGKGIHNFFLGFLYKFIIGYYFGQVLMPVAAKIAEKNGGFSWALVAYMYIYSMYLFFDFAGYSLFAVGTSYLMGYDTPVNFNKPFLSWNIKEFWNRWHMTLSFWFRDYIYMRLMFTLIKKKVFKSRIVASNVGYFALFLLMGVWHGLTWYYLAYGIYHATLICVTDAWLRFKKKHKDSIPSNKFTHALAVFLTFNAVCFSFLIFSGFLDTLFFK
ncbi:MULTISPECIES: D-alanyl-lipoteichoic acid biosynthesis protein DltB [unclassified Enterococcus]|uniref:D-alanyl-lipoteichoic acid biosynthesis protein DltB n=1 Tax=unclassified Enterococcus TaxID=2608891 RepID=UPI001CE0BBD4|nr:MULTISPECIES: D-alanyl-lipoteichoic acid biosynthesis protein DltB [unclassified Enterococcus]MCA5011496.1 D-alanyl-lipoteichoic acid biosynthesis protein DltB [Enterococcus sp. S23]MCA5015062.1 D-alanyl-lipoteichoic acid biosynthesis protein DltB [Enterococcus sp. S22(2020)]